MSWAIKFQELGPAAQAFLGGLGMAQSEAPKNWLGRQLVAQLKKTLRWRLDKLILLDDPSVRVMALKAMETINYRSQHLGFIATLYASEEIGYVVSPAGERGNPEHVSIQAWRYLMHLLDVPIYSKDLQYCKNHWEGVLKIDYTKEFSVEKYWDRSGKVPELKRREVPSEEVAAHIAKNKAEVRELYQRDLDELLKKKADGYYERRLLEVHQCLEDIFKYLLRQNLSKELDEKAREMLASIARTGKFHDEWLRELSQKYAK